MKKLLVGIAVCASYLGFATPIQAAGTEISTYTTNTLGLLTLVAGVAASLFLVYSGYLYITSSGNPEALEHAKKTLKNALVGLVLVLAATSVISIFQNALNPTSSSSSASAISITPITTLKPADGLTQVLLDAVTGFMQNLVQSSTKPIVNGILGYVTTTPSVLNNSVINQFWLVSLGIVDTLFVLVVALLGLHIMSASVFGFEELELKQVLPKVGLCFLGANISLFLADYVIVTCNALVTTVLNSTGGLNQAWILSAVNPTSLVTGTTPLITLVFLIVFLILAVVLLLMYISRLIIIAVGAVLSPFVFLLAAIPKCSDFAMMAIKSYLVSVFMIFIHVIIIQLAAAFLTFPEGSTNNSLVSIAAAIGLLATILKTPSLMMGLVSSAAQSGIAKKLGGQIMNVMSTSQSTAQKVEGAAKNPDAKIARKAKYI